MNDILLLPYFSYVFVCLLIVANALVSVGVPTSSTVPENNPSLEVCVEVTGVQTIQANFNATIVTSDSKINNSTSAIIPFYL